MSGSSYKAESKNVGELIGIYSRRQLIIPEFQRGYSWTKKEVDVLWEDLDRFERDSSAARIFLARLSQLFSKRRGILIC